MAPSRVEGADVSDPDARPSQPPAPAPPAGPATPGPARVVDHDEAVRQAARQLSEPLARLATAVRAARDHLDTDPVRARDDLERARTALEALRDELTALGGGRREGA